jgi:hypothetical protein
LEKLAAQAVVVLQPLVATVATPIQVMKAAQAAQVEPLLELLGEVAVLGLAAVAALQLK